MASVVHDDDDDDDDDDGDELLYTSLHKRIYYAVVNGDKKLLAEAIRMIRAREDLPFRKDPEYHNTPLHYAAKYGRTDIT